MLWSVLALQLPAIFTTWSKLEVYLNHTPYFHTEMLAIILKWFSILYRCYYSQNYSSIIISGLHVAHVIDIWRGPMYYFLPERGLLRLTHRYKNKGWNRSRHVGGREWSSCLSFLGGDFRTLSGIIAPTTGIRFQFKANVMWVPCWPRSQPHTVLASFPAPYHVGLIPSPTPCWPHFQPHTVLASFPYCVGLIPILCWPHSQPLAETVGRGPIL